MVQEMCQGQASNRVLGPTTLPAERETGADSLVIGDDYRDLTVAF